MKTLLITGGSGFIGKALIDFIKNNYDDSYKLVLLSSCKINDFPTVLHGNYTYTIDDFYTLGIDRVDVVIHLGAFTPKSSLDSNSIRKSNENIVNTTYLLDNLPNIPVK